MIRRVVVLGFIAVFIAGCGGSSDAAKVSQLADRMNAALKSHDWPAFCALVAPDVRSKMEAVNGCQKQLAAAPPSVEKVTGIKVDGDHATAHDAANNSTDTFVKVDGKWYVGEDR